MPVEVLVHDSLEESKRWYIDTLPRGGSTPIDTSRIEHGVAAVEMTGDVGAAPTWQALADQIREDLQR